MREDKKKKGKGSALGKLAGMSGIVVGAVLVLMILYLAPRLRGITVEDILNYSPGSPVIAAAAAVGAYAFKSITVFFPVMVLYISVGLILPTPVNLAVNSAGLVVMVSVPYFIGKILGREAVEGLAARYPKARKIQEFGMDNELFLCFFTRVINMLPGDLVSLFMGASGIRYLPFLVGSLLGLAPVMIPATLMGGSLTDPLSPEFIIPVVVIALVSLFSMVLYRRLQKKKNG